MTVQELEQRYRDKLDRLTSEAAQIYAAFRVKGYVSDWGIVMGRKEKPGEVYVTLANTGRRGATCIAVFTRRNAPAAEVVQRYNALIRRIAVVQGRLAYFRAAALGTSEGKPGTTVGNEYSVKKIDQLRRRGVEYPEDVMRRNDTLRAFFLAHPEARSPKSGGKRGYFGVWNERGGVDLSKYEWAAA